MLFNKGRELQRTKHVKAADKYTDSAAIHKTGTTLELNNKTKKKKMSHVPCNEQKRCVCVINLGTFLASILLRRTPLDRHQLSVLER